MERDDESGLEYHGARYYAPWLGRWLAPDTHADKLDGNRYAYVKNNPVINRDRNGLYEETVHGLATYRLALAAGFSGADAGKIAIAAAGMDHDPATRPGDNAGELIHQILSGRTQEYHFPSQEAALARVEGDIAGGVADLEAFGRHLHSLQDVGFKEASGPHSRSNDRALSPLIAIAGGWAASAGAILAIETGASSGWARGSRAAAGIGAGILLALGVLAITFAIIAEGVGHPSYETERGEYSQLPGARAHYTDQAFQNPKANTAQLRLIYDQLKRAAVASGRAIGPADDAAADAAIRDVVGSSAPGHIGEGADTSEDINAMLTRPTSDVLGRTTASYADLVATQGRWRVEQIDVSLDRGRTYRPLPAR